MTTIDGWAVDADGIASEHDGPEYSEVYVNANTHKSYLRVRADRPGQYTVTDVPLAVVRALLENAGYTVRDSEQETQAIVNVSEIVADRDTARAEVARLRALCAEAARAAVDKDGEPWTREYLAELTARLAAAGKGET